MLESAVLKMRSRIGCAALVASMLAQGCAYQYVHARTGEQHLWGVGHFVVKVQPANEGIQAVMVATEVAGLSAGVAHDQTYFTVGWHRTQALTAIDDDTSIRLDLSGPRLTAARVGSVPPGVDATREELGLEALDEE